MVVLDSEYMALQFPRRNWIPKQIGAHLRPVVGLDIGSHAAKLLSLSGSPRSGYRILAAGMEPITDHSINEGRFVNPRAVGADVQRLVKRLRRAPGKVVVAVPDSLAIVKTVEMQAGLSEDAMEDLMSLEAERHIPYPLHEVALDFHIQGPSRQSPDEHVEVTLAACRKEHIDGLLEVVGAAGLTATAIDIDSRALLRACDWARPFPEIKDGLLAIFDLGGASVTLSVLAGARLLYSREQRLGSEELPARMPAASSSENPDDTGACPAVSEAVTARDVVARQVVRALRFFFSADPHQAVSGILLSGGMAAVPGLAAEVEKQLAAPVAVLDPFVGMRIGAGVDGQLLRSAAPGLVVACGLAMHGRCG